LSWRVWNEYARSH